MSYFWMMRERFEREASCVPLSKRAYPIGSAVFRASAIKLPSERILNGFATGGTPLRQ